MQRRKVVSCRRFGTTYRSHLQGSSSFCDSTLSKIAKERRFHFHSGWSLKSRRVQVRIQCWWRWGGKHKLRIEVPEMRTLIIWHLLTEIHDCVMKTRKRGTVVNEKIQADSMLAQYAKTSNDDNELVDVPIGSLARILPYWPRKYPACSCWRHVAMTSRLYGE